MLPLIPIPFPGFIIRVSSFLFSSVLRRFYTRQKLSELVDIQVCHDPSGITINCSELPDISAWIEISNSSPFHITVHEFEAGVYLTERVANLVKICNVDVAPSGTERLFVQSDLTAKQIDYIRRHKYVETPKLKVNAMFSCRLSTFEINDREITTHNLDFINCVESAETE